ncbi:Vacuolar protein sorting-associated protein 30 [Komagataella phaffii CBS 7435]|uniref:Subunit of phosphatidylinositol (PtdIns) 3-kinase complexes I and II n=2 Tax=Komagataella phaffii TaxID=460519 RepID=C4QZZ5_KOMPG|nr:Subunit of phosphatidylinositol (PtdIns) 3-kinase complexes I and II [Komagataella phaffii GS115]AOA61892.1 GQ67_00239T0 [Komagataella phaffii]CAH2448680.1 Vacuolar protein sorting-associated protein 30 [Komagataella phaffii CBS 7435]AOA67155.1 GQ68_01149T0 [Komagataella phaffii GS115]CAY68819.1 Subunit of phosphatidylinositol (PtdIns) 3-kinase complexes I and II [Komagataella phaffii GS115]CCA38773.1 Vacuolar protein sorting-associated protein 30 [Komagataella phaffii CBS 7435]
MNEAEYKCQRCRLPLTIDGSLEDLSISQANLLTGRNGNFTKNTIPLEDAVEEDLPKVPQSRLNLFKEVYQKMDHDFTNARDEFVVLNKHNDNSDVNVEYDYEENNTISRRINTMTNIFNILSNKYEIDFPVCYECATLLMEELKNEYERVNADKEVYAKFLSKLRKQDAGTNMKERTAQLLEQLEKTKQEERDKEKKLQGLYDERDSLEKVLASLENEMEQLNIEEQQIFELENKYEYELMEFKNEQSRMEAMYEDGLTQLDNLRKVNVFNDAFNISHDGQFGTINGLRLGTLDSKRVSWYEINAALGQVVLLLFTLLSRLELELKHYKIFPIGSTSKIEYQVDPDSKPVTINCFSSGEQLLDKLFHSNKLDPAMNAILEITIQIADHFTKQDPTNELPYKMENETISNLNIKPSKRKSNEEWTLACKHLLTNLKWIIAFSSST